MVKEPERAIILDENADTAAVVMAGLEAPDEFLPLTEKGKHLKVGNEVGWVGFPAVASAFLCFFSGRVSTWMNPQSAYLVDGVAINGVSGGPAFLPVGKRPYIVGVMSAYIPNRATGEALPGLCVISNVWQLHDVVQQLRNMGEARKTAEDAIVKQGAEGGR